LPGLEPFCYGCAVLSRRHAFLIVKLIVAGLLLAWLVRSGSLDFSLLAIFFERPVLIAGNVAVFVGTYLMAAVRWRVLLRSTGVELPLGRAIQLTFTATFFNVAVPGNIGGDVVKAIYVARDVAPELRASVYLVGLLDRLLALAGLVVVAVVLSLGAHALPGEQQLGNPTTALAVIAVLTLVVPAATLVLIRRSGKRVGAWTQSPSGVARLVGRLVASARLVSERPRSH